MIIPEWVFQEPFEKKGKYSPKTLKQIARKDIKLDYKQMSTEIFKNMINPFFSTDRVLQLDFNIGLYSQQINHAVSEKLLNLISPDSEYTSAILKNPKRAGYYLC